MVRVRSIMRVAYSDSSAIPLALATAMVLGEALRQTGALPHLITSEST